MALSLFHLFGYAPRGRSVMHLCWRELTSANPELILKFFFRPFGANENKNICPLRAIGRCFSTRISIHRVYSNNPSHSVRSSKQQGIIQVASIQIIGDLYVRPEYSFFFYGRVISSFSQVNFLPDRLQFYQL